MYHIKNSISHESETLVVKNLIEKHQLLTAAVLLREATSENQRSPRKAKGGCSFDSACCCEDVVPATKGDNSTRSCRDTLYQKRNPKQTNLYI